MRYENNNSNVENRVYLLILPEVIFRSPCLARQGFGFFCAAKVQQKNNINKYSSKKMKKFIYKIIFERQILTTQIQFINN